ncbi:4Fe-4S dicluster domain-containing protein [candidate division KSB1 bacterium]|nr:4Fe-4S dicluster domain-containing protein [candidate division KSB1 bacterium]
MKRNPKIKSGRSTDKAPRMPQKKGAGRDRRDNLKNALHEDHCQIGFGRRSFLKIGAYSVATAALTGCQRPVEKAIPYLNKPEEITPGIANWYASTCGACPSECGILVKTREGRPVKLEGNKLDIRSGGGLCAVGQASIWSLYDSERMNAPMINGTASSWNDIDELVPGQIMNAAQQGKKTYLLTGSIVSPTIREAIGRFLNVFPDATHIEYNAVSHSAIAESHRRTHGREVIPSYRFNNAKVIVAFNADFLGTWLSPVEFTAQYSSGRRLETDDAVMSRHIQFESRMSLTGSNADLRVPVSHDEEKQSLLYLARLITEKSSTQNISGSERRFAEISQPSNNTLSNHIVRTAEELWTAKGESLLICGTNDVNTQSIVNYINHGLGNYGNTIVFNRSHNQFANNDSDVVDMVNDMNNGGVGTLIVWNTNPAYHYPEADEFLAGLERVDIKISLSGWKDETAGQMTFLCPDHHFLEAWGDAEVENGYYTVRQPTIRPLHNTRQGAESLLRWAGIETNMYDFLKNFWNTNIFPNQSSISDFQSFWDSTLHDGIYSGSNSMRQSSSVNSSRYSFNFGQLDDTLTQLSSQISLSGESNSEFELELYESVALRDGSSAGVPWLQELPDPITKVTWDNVALIAPSTAESLDLHDGDEIRVTSNGKTIHLPVLVQPGQHEKVISTALGYGRRNAVNAGKKVGVNAFGLISFKESAFKYSGETIQIEPTGNRVNLAKTQTHNSSEGRDLVRQFTFEEFKSENFHGLEESHTLPNMWSDHDHKDHRWAMTVDLNTCTGCSACIIGCQAENNISTVGKEEVFNRREMHWIRIDRYYNNDTVQHQPIMCAHCDKAPCETVCPVLAAVHSSDGLNIQNYNRCIGTRYCENNCPYKVRRFNWFEYARDKPLENLQLNPDVTVRSRGVMEKCTFCVQRIQEKRIKARRENRPVQDGEIQTACQQSCPAGAIAFGDMNDPDSKVSKLIEQNRSYRLLTELNVEPAVWYLAKIRNQA